MEIKLKHDEIKEAVQEWLDKRWTGDAQTVATVKAESTGAAYGSADFVVVLEPAQATETDDA